MKKQQKGVLIAISIFGLLMLINGIRYKLVFSRGFTDIDSAGASVSVGKAADCTVTWSIGPFDSDIDYFKRSDRYIKYYLSETANGNLICVRSTNDKLETTRKYYLDTKNKQLVDRTRFILNNIFVEPKESDIQIAVIRNSLEKKLEDIPQETIIDDADVENASKLLNAIHSKTELSSNFVIKKTIVRKEKRKILLLVFDDGHQEEIDITDAEEL